MYRIFFVTGLIMLLVGVLLAFVMVVGCQESEKTRKVSLEGGDRIPVALDIHGENGSLTAVVSGVYVPEDRYDRLLKIFGYISKKLGRSIIVERKDTEAEIIDAIQDGAFDIAFTGRGAYILCSDRLVPLAAPIIGGMKSSPTYIIAGSESAITSMEDLKGRTFCFGPSCSVTGYMIPVQMFTQRNHVPHTFLKRTDLAKSHFDVIEAVARKLADAGAVSGNVWELLASEGNRFVVRTRVIEKSMPVPNPPVSVRADMGQNMQQEIGAILIAMNQDTEGRRILEGLMIDRFVKVSDSDYDPVREIMDKIK